MRVLTKDIDQVQSFNCDTFILPLYEGARLGGLVKSIDAASKGLVKSLLDSGEFESKAGNTLVIPAAPGLKSKRIVLWGLGDKDKLTRQTALKAAAALAGRCKSLKGKHIAFASELKNTRNVPSDWLLQTIATQIVRSTYHYSQTKPSAAKQGPDIDKLTVLNASTADQKRAAKRGQAIGEGINTARHLGDLPGNVCTPKYLSAEARKLGRKHDSVTTKVLGEKAMRELGMGSLLSVGHGSDEESQLIIMEYKGAAKSERPHVLLGKGITFDTGGISLKPGGKMDEMKFDMCGAASVVGAMQALAEMKLKINVTGVIAAAENMPSSRATKPGDVVTSMSGKTIEVLNTDAEGRLVLCDALTYIERFKPQSVVDMATLTGACIVALGHHASGLMSNDDQLADKLLSAGEASGDRAWRLPIWDDYLKQLKSPFADLANIGGPSAGTITAACFLGQFAESYPWAHLDIAGTAWNQGGGKGASGRPVSLLCQYLMDLS